MDITNPVDMRNTIFTIQGKKLDEYSNLNGKKTEEDLKKAASDFEAVFVKQFLDVMDSTVQKSEFLHGGSAEDTFKGMLNEQMAINIASNPNTSFGFAEQIYRQMKDRM
jgi:Rod binding domain-containing protein